MKFKTCSELTKMLDLLFRKARKEKKVIPQAYYMSELGIDAKTSNDLLDLISNLSILITRAYALEMQIVCNLLQKPDVVKFCKAVFVNDLPNHFWHSRSKKSSTGKIRNPVVGKQLIRKRPSALLNWSGTASKKLTLTKDLKEISTEIITLRALDPKALRQAVVFYNNSEDTDAFEKLRVACENITQYVEEQDNSDNFFFMLKSLLGSLNFFANERETLTLVSNARCEITRVGSKYAKQAQIK